MSEMEYMSQKAAIGLASEERNAGLDAFRVFLLICLLGGGVGIVGFGVRSLEPMVGMVMEASLPLAGFILASRLSARSDGSPQTLFTIWKAYVRIMPVYGLGLLSLMTLAMRLGMPMQGGVLHLGFAGTLFGSRQDDLAGAWSVAVVWWGHVVLCVLSQVLCWIPWARVGHRNVWLAGWIVALVVPVLREVASRVMPLETVDLVHGAVWRLDSVGWGVVVYGILRRFRVVGSLRMIRVSAVVGLTGLWMVAVRLAAASDWSGQNSLLGLLQSATAISISLMLPWWLVWRVPCEVRTRPWLELLSRMAYPVFVSFLVVFQAGGGKASVWLGAGPLQRALLAGLLSMGIGWVIGGFVQPVLNQLLMGQSRRFRRDA